MSSGICNYCNKELKHIFVDLGLSPLSNSFLSHDQLNVHEEIYPLKSFICENCLLVQLNHFVMPEKIFNQYFYFSSYSESWLSHIKSYTDMIVNSFEINKDSQIIEIASNDGYLLQFFVDKVFNKVLGIEPAENVAEVSKSKGINTISRYFGVKLAKELVDNNVRADLLIGNNVLAHVPGINDFIEGMKILLNDDGVLTMEFPHILNLIDQNQFDTIYHEHFYYFSFIVVNEMFESHGLKIFDVEELPTHGGSLRIYVKHMFNDKHAVSRNVYYLFKKEEDFGLTKLETYLEFNEKVKLAKENLLDFLICLKNENKTVVSYGAPAKGNTLLNYCGITTDIINYTVDINPHKQGHYLPGTHIPIFHPDKISETKPDYLLILPWNIKEEIIKKMNHIREWGGRFIVPIPKLEVI